MNKYDYLINTHDLETLSDWGPFARDVYALSHIADRKRGVKFDFLFIPGILRRSFFPPETLRECGCSPYEAAPDLSYFSFRQQLEGQDIFYADSSYADIGGNLWLGRCEFVNNTSELRACALLAVTRLAPRPDVVPFIPENSRFIDALDYSEIEFSYNRFDHNLTFAGGRRGEQNYPGTVNNRCIGQPAYCKTLPCFGAKKGDRIVYRFTAAPQDHTIYGRIRVDSGKTMSIRVSVNGSVRTLELAGTGNFELVELHRSALTGRVTVEISSSADGCGIRIDGFVIGDADLSIQSIKFAPLGRAVEPKFMPGSIPESCLISGEGLDHGYCVWWSRKASAERDYSVENLPQFANYSYGLRHPYFTQWQEFGDEICRDAYILPLDIPAGGNCVVYTLYSAGKECSGAEKIIAQMDKSDCALEKLWLQARKRASIPCGTPAGRPYEFSQKLMRATSLCNINFPISRQGCNIRHHVPDKYYNSLYSWDSGFIGLGFLELDKTRAIENLNVYVTEPEDEENAFLLYGTPLPVQAYLYAEIWNRYQDKEMLEFFYPRLRKFYNFIAGHTPTSTFRCAKSDLLYSRDYFYNSGGWDDYPPQWDNAKNKACKCVPAVTTAHAIRFAKILRQAAELLDITGDLESYDRDITAFTNALQNISWSSKDSVFSYVEHDAEGNPAGFMLDPSGKENYNFGMDGVSPLISGICTAEQRDKLFARLADPEGMWTDIGISTVDKRAGYYRTDGYWNGCVWMPHQWFFWKAALDDNRKEFARKIAITALELWKNEVDQSRYCFEHFSVSSHRGAGCCHFGGLSSPVLNWYGAYFEKHRLTSGCDCWITGQKHTGDSAEAELKISGNSGDFITVLYVAGDGEWQARYNGMSVECSSGVPGCLEITLPKNSRGKLEIFRK
ncbi:MAG: hypothetical protein IJC27_05945 [Lentisphaeria bacterium]|nr:hypothetical protein [Lentisphaeria bacterium]